MVTKIVTSAINSGIPKEEIQILAPMYKGQAGINHLNQLMQDLLNPLGDGQEFLFNDIHLRRGDKILHLVNDAQLNVFNGDIGYISDLIPAKYTESKQDEIIMAFDGTEVTYPRNEWLKITLAYAMSIHKSQGSEFQVVILPITHQGGRLLQRNLIYTAVTRSKSKLILLGEYSAFHYAIQKEGDKRQTYLVQRFTDSSLTETLDNDSGDDHLQNAQLSPQKITNDVQYLPIKDSGPQEEESYRLTLENMLSIDPMIGLKEEDILIFFNKN